MMHTRCPNAGCHFDSDAEGASDLTIDERGRVRCPLCETWMGQVRAQKNPKIPERYPHEDEKEALAQLRSELYPTADEIEAELDSDIPVSQEELEAEVPDDDVVH